MIRLGKRYDEDIERILPHILHVEHLRGKTVLITGATGMIGSAVCDVLLYLNRVKDANMKLLLAGRSRERMQKRFGGAIEGKDYTYVAYDATRMQSLQIQADYLIHGASNAHPALFGVQPVETMLANIAGLQSVLETARMGNSRRVLYISSSEVYGNPIGSDIHRKLYEETDYGYVDIMNPRAAYPSAKRAAETLCAAYIQEYGMDIAIVRPGHIYGQTITDSDSRASAQFTRCAVNGEDIIMKSAGDQLRSYCYVLDCASAILTVLLGGQKGEAYNISNCNSVVTIRELAEALARAAGVSVCYANPSDAEQNSYNLMKNSALCAGKLEALGWRAEFGLTEGAERTIALFCNE